MEKKMENEIDTGIILGCIRVILGFGDCGPIMEDQMDIQERGKSQP